MQRDDAPSAAAEPLPQAAWLTPARPSLAATLFLRLSQRGQPCLPDMKPVIGPTPEKEGLWLAQMIDGEEPAVDMTPFRVDRSECEVARKRASLIVGPLAPAICATGNSMVAFGCKPDNQNGTCRSAPMSGVTWQTANPSGVQTTPTVSRLVYGPARASVGESTFAKDCKNSVRASCFVTFPAVARSHAA